MKKIKVIYINKNEHRSEYSFPKENSTIRIIKNILIELGFDEIEISHYFHDVLEDFDLESYNQETCGFYSQKYSVDIIYFQKEIVLIFNHEKDLQNEISEVMNKFILDEE